MCRDEPYEGMLILWQGLVTKSKVRPTHLQMIQRIPSSSATTPQNGGNPSLSRSGSLGLGLSLSGSQGAFNYGFMGGGTEGLAGRMPSSTGNTPRGGGFDRRGSGFERRSSIKVCFLILLHVLHTLNPTLYNLHSTPYTQHYIVYNLHCNPKP